ncbi:MAG: hypothetical protein ACC660_04860, partial [Acidimicrobiales bacterium]
MGQVVGRIRVEQHGEHTVVVKRAESATECARLAAEAGRLSSLAHPGLVEFVDFVETDVHSQLTTVYAGSLTLADFSPPNHGSAAGVVAGVAAVIADLHAAGVSHRGLTDDHVILGGSRHAVLCSLGTARTDDADGMASDVRALGDLLQELSRRCPRPATRSARRQDRAIQAIIRSTRQPHASAQETAASLAALPGAIARAAPPADTARGAEPPIESKPTDTRTWRDRVPPLGVEQRVAPGYLAFALWCGGLAAALWILHSVGSAGLATPPMPWVWGRWLQHVETATAIVSVLRVVAIACAWYLAVVTVIGAIARRSAGTGFVHAADRVTPGFLRTLLGSARGLTWSAAGLTMAVVPLLAVPQERSVPTLDAVTAGTAVAQAEPLPAATPASQTGSAEIVRAQPPRPTRSVPGPAVFELAPFVQADAGGETWVVETGDHLWGIAEETLLDAWGRQPGEPEIARYWLRLIESNRDRLA